jgi:hypothetical protein
VDGDLERKEPSVITSSGIAVGSGGTVIANGPAVRRRPPTLSSEYTSAEPYEAESRK